MSASTTVTFHFSNGVDVTSLLNAINSNFNAAVNGVGLPVGQFALNQMVAWFNSQFAQYNATLAAQAGAAAVAAAAAGQTSLNITPYNPVNLIGTLTVSQP
jgi:hypothetical protein